MTPNTNTQNPKILKPPETLFATSGLEVICNGVSKSQSTKSILVTDECKRFTVWGL